MKNQIKSIVALLFASLVLASCNNEFDDHKNMTSYPKQLNLGCWERDITPDGNTYYTVNFTKNEQGDTIADITQYDAASGKANVFGGGEVNYNPTTGQAVIEYAESPYDSPARIYFTYKNDLHHATVNIYTKSSESLTAKARFTAIPAVAPSVYGDWENSNGLKFTLNSDGSATITINETEQSGNYTFSGREGIITLTDGTSITLAFNTDGQLLAQYNGQNYVMSHVLTPIKIEWNKFAKGVFRSSIMSDLFGQDMAWEQELEYSPQLDLYRFSDPYYISEHYCTPGYEITFKWDGNQDIRFDNDSYEIGFSHPSYGMMSAKPQASMFDAENDALLFQFEFTVSAGSFGAAVEEFDITKRY